MKESKFKVGDWVEQVRWLEKGQSPLCKIVEVLNTPHNAMYHKHLGENKNRRTTQDFMYFISKPISRAKAILKYGFDIEKEEYV